MANCVIDCGNCGGQKLAYRSESTFTYVCATCGFQKSAIDVIMDTHLEPKPKTRFKRILRVTHG